MLTGWRSFNDALRTIDFLNRHIDVVFDGPFVERGLASAPRARPAWPAVNVGETKEAFVYTAEVPGLSEGDVTVQVEDGALLLRGERKAETREGYESHLRERASYAFARTLPLPGRVDAQGVTATMKDGILTVTLPKAKDALPRQIAVKSA
ncbi:MAG TPA: Hsp20/alpha crystallin family protein [Polyangiaceae bacterium]|jgi:HSP20 family protein|nr:Hsp20/alpha crystallin family protein [Polyangiaceae bacterium]